jgi:hypothetical protein
MIIVFVIKLSLTIDKIIFPNNKTIGIIVSGSILVGFHNFLAGYATLLKKE